jgi:type II secretory pathway component PulC
MSIKKINHGIVIASISSRFLIKMAFAMFLAKLFWWLIIPSYNQVYVDRVKINQKDNAVRYIINRYPFGDVVESAVTTKSAPAFSSLIKLHGVYASGSDSIAFVEYNNKNLEVPIGGEIFQGVILNKVNDDSIIITKGGTDAVIGMSKADGSPNNNMNHRVIHNSYTPPPAPLNNNNDSQHNAAREMMEKRQEMIEKFAHQEANDNNHDSGDDKNNSDHHHGTPSE